MKREEGTSQENTETKKREIEKKEHMEVRKEIIMKEETGVKCNLT